MLQSTSITYRLMLAISPLLSLEYVPVNIGNDGVSIQNAALDVRNQGAAVHNVLMNVRNSYMGIYCELSLKINS